MANIDNELYEILQAIKGEDVRTSIYRGLLKVNNECVSTTTLVDALNEAITGQTGTNVASFVAQVEALVGGYSEESSPVTLNNCTDDFYMLPGQLVVLGISGIPKTISFTIPLAEKFLSSENGYEITITDMNLSIWKYNGRGFFKDTLGLSPYGGNVVVAGTLSDISSCSASVKPLSNKLHVVLGIDAQIYDDMGAAIETGMTPCFVSINKLAFEIDENAVGATGST